VKKTPSGRWKDDNNGDWTDLVSGPNAAASGRPVGWDVTDNDIAVIDTASLGVSYVHRLMNLCMAIGIDPSTGDVTIVGTEATNEIRFEPNVQGRFTRVELARAIQPGLTSTSIVDLNPHLTYLTPTIPQVDRDRSIGDPRGIVWNAAGTRAYVTGMGSNNLIVIDAAGARAGVSPTVDVGEGPTGIVLDAAHGRLLVLDKFEAAISVVDLASELETARVPFHDASPQAIKAGRKHLYDTHKNSGLGQIACGSCHIDARLDHLAWDLGNPAGTMKPVAGQNLGANIPGLNVGFQPWHPMKGPMTTQTLQDIIGKEPFHWRGDRDGLEEFNGAFIGLQGDDTNLTPAEMQEFEDFLATVTFPPNPFRNFDNTLPTNLPLPGHHTTGRFGPAGNPLPNGNAVAGMALYRPPNLLDASNLACVTCHTLPLGMGTNYRLQGGTLVPIAPGPNGERHHMLVAVDGSTNVTIKVPQLRNVYEKVGFDATQLLNTSGFGVLHDGSVDSLERFVDEPVFSVQSDQQTADLVAFMLSIGGSDLPPGSTNPFAGEPPGDTEPGFAGRGRRPDDPARREQPRSRPARADRGHDRAGEHEEGRARRARRPSRHPARLRLRRHGPVPVRSLGRDGLRGGAPGERRARERADVHGRAAGHRDADRDRPGPRRLPRPRRAGRRERSRGPVEPRLRSGRDLLRGRRLARHAVPLREHGRGGPRLRELAGGQRRGVADGERDDVAGHGGVHGLGRDAGRALDRASGLARDRRGRDVRRRRALRRGDAEAPLHEERRERRRDRARPRGSLGDGALGGAGRSSRARHDARLPDVLPRPRAELLPEPERQHLQRLERLPPDLVGGAAGRYFPARSFERRRSARTSAFSASGRQAASGGASESALSISAAEPSPSPERRSARPRP
jgi:YVTN family beta-propeller protein